MNMHFNHALRTVRVSTGWLNIVS